MASNNQTKKILDSCYGQIETYKKLNGIWIARLVSEPLIWEAGCSEPGALGKLFISLQICKSHLNKE
jgi:hypothetical protein